MIWSFYDAATGEISGRTFSGSASLLALNTRAGQVAIEGVFNHREQRIDVATGEPVDYQPGIDAVRAERRARRAAERIVSLEAAQLRPLRELALDPDSVAARQRLAEIEAAIAAVRGDL